MRKILKITGVILAIAVVLSAAYLPTPAASAAGDGMTTISFAIPTAWDSKTWTEVRMNFQKTDGSWSWVTLENTGRKTTYSSSEVDRPVYSATFDRTAVMGGDYISRMQFQIHNGTGDPHDTYVDQYEFEKGYNKYVPNYDETIFIYNQGYYTYQNDYLMTVYFAAPEEWTDDPTLVVMMNAEIKNTSRRTFEAMTATGDYYEVDGKELATYSITFDRYEVFGLFLRYSKLYFQRYSGDTWVDQVKWLDGNAENYDGKVFFGSGGADPEEYAPLSGALRLPFTSSLELKFGDVGPDVTFEYKVEYVGYISDDEVDASSYRTVNSEPTADPVHFSSDESYGEAKKLTKEFFVNLRGTKFNEVGIYRYKVTEIDPKVARVSADDKVIYIDVYVTRSANGRLTINTIVHSESGAKTAAFENLYGAYDITISKTVSGNQGNTSKYFKFTVKLELDGVALLPGDAAAFTVDLSNAEADPETNRATKYSEMHNPDSVTFDELNEGVDFYLKDGQSVKIIGLPGGVSYSVTEDAENYTSSAPNGFTGTLDENLVCAFENTRNVDLPTGVVLSVLPGAALLAIGGLGILTSRKKREEDWSNQN